MSRDTQVLKIGVCAALLSLQACQGSGSEARQEASDTIATEQVSQVDSIHILLPDASSELRRGEPFTIRWQGGADTLSVFLVDSSLQDAGASVSIADRKYGIPNHQSLEYTPPKRLEPGTYKLQVGAVSSDYFTIK